MFISDMTLYASREEVEQLYNNITKMCEPYLTKDRHDADQEVFHLFSSLSKDTVNKPVSETAGKLKKKASPDKGKSVAKTSRPAKKQKESSSGGQAEE